MLRAVGDSWARRHCRVSLGRVRLSVLKTPSACCDARPQAAAEASSMTITRVGGLGRCTFPVDKRRQQAADGAPLARSRRRMTRYCGRFAACLRNDCNRRRARRRTDRTLCRSAFVPVMESADLRKSDHSPIALK
jgi:hypothetical protein